MISDSFEILRVAYPNWSDEQIVQEIKKRIQELLDHGELIDVIDIFDIVSKEEDRKWNAANIAKRIYENNKKKFVRILKAIKKCTFEEATQEIERRYQSLVEHGRKIEEIQDCDIFTKVESDLFEKVKSDARKQDDANFLDKDNQEKPTTPQIDLEKHEIYNKKPLNVSDEEWAKKTDEMNSTIADTRENPQLQVPDWLMREPDNIDDFWQIPQMKYKPPDHQNLTIGTHSQHHHND